MLIKGSKRNFKKFIHSPKPFQDHWYFLVCFITTFLSLWVDGFLFLLFCFVFFYSFLIILCI